MSKYKIIAKLEIEIDTIMKGREKDVALNRRRELEDWIKRHYEDIYAVVCSQFDTISNLEVSVEERDE